MPRSVVLEIRRLYFRASETTIERDLKRAVELLKTLPDEASRERAAVYMDGLSLMRSEWRLGSRRAPRGSPKTLGKKKR